MWFREVGGRCASRKTLKGLTCERGFWGSRRLPREDWSEHHFYLGTRGCLLVLWHPALSEVVSGLQNCFYAWFLWTSDGIEIYKEYVGHTAFDPWQQRGGEIGTLKRKRSQLREANVSGSELFPLLQEKRETSPRFGFVNAAWDLSYWTEFGNFRSRRIVMSLKQALDVCLHSVLTALWKEKGACFLIFLEEIYILKVVQNMLV